MWRVDALFVESEYFFSIMGTKILLEDISSLATLKFEYK